MLLTAAHRCTQWRLVYKSPSMSVDFHLKSVILRENFKPYVWRVSFATEVYPSAVGLSTLYVSHKSLWVLNLLLSLLGHASQCVDCVLITEYSFFPQRRKDLLLGARKENTCFPKAKSLIGRISGVYKRYKSCCCLRFIRHFYFGCPGPLLRCPSCSWWWLLLPQSTRVEGTRASSSGAAHSLGLAVARWASGAQQHAGSSPSCLGGKYLSFLVYIPTLTGRLKINAGLFKHLSPFLFI